MSGNALVFGFEASQSGCQAIGPIGWLFSILVLCFGGLVYGSLDLVSYMLFWL